MYKFRNELVALINEKIKELTELTQKKYFYTDQNVDNILDILNDIKKLTIDVSNIDYTSKNDNHIL